jgi:hypothetical protein
MAGKALDAFQPRKGLHLKAVPLRKIRALSAAALASTALFALTAPAANAGLLVTSAYNCDAETFSHPFAQFGDNANYTLMPGGSFEKGSQAWSVTGGAKVVSGNESYKVRGATDAQSLYLPQGATATSPSMCVGIDHPTARWFAKSSGSLLGLTGAMTVSVVFEDSLGQVLELPIGAGLLNTSWQPSLPGVVSASLLPLLPDQHTAVAFRFRALSGNWNVDDTYVDPWAKW